MKIVIAVLSVAVLQLSQANLIESNTVSSEAKHGPIALSNSDEICGTDEIRRIRCMYISLKRLVKDTAQCLTANFSLWEKIKNLIGRAGNDDILSYQSDDHIHSNEDDVCNHDGHHRAYGDDFVDATETDKKKCFTEAFKKAFKTVASCVLKESKVIFGKMLEEEIKALLDNIM